MDNNGKIIFEPVMAYLFENRNKILLIIISLLAVRLFKFAMQVSRERKRIRKEKELASKVRQDEALDNEILNPDRKPGDVTEKKHPYQVVYYEQKESLKGIKPYGNRKSNAVNPVKILFSSGKEEEPLPPGTLLKITEYSGLSYKSYTYKSNEVVRVGSRYGKTGILAGESADQHLFFDIVYKEGHFCLYSSREAEVVIERGKASKKVETAARIILKAGDLIKVNDRVYEVGFI